MRESLKLTDKEIAASFRDSAAGEKFPPILTVSAAAELLHVPVGTIRDWRSRGLLRGCCRKVGRHVRFYRDRLIKLIFNEGLLDD